MGGSNFPPFSTALIPMLITNANIYRLKPTITNLDTIREASSPQEIADEIQWTWYYFDPSKSQFDNNYDLIKKHEKERPGRIKKYKTRMQNFADRPNWILVTNIKYLESAIVTISKHFMSLRTIKIN
jgi:hypothetical protein